MSGENVQNLHSEEKYSIAQTDRIMIGIQHAEKSQKTENIGFQHLPVADVQGASARIANISTICRLEKVRKDTCRVENNSTWYSPLRKNAAVPL